MTTVSGQANASSRWRNISQHSAHFLSSSGAGSYTYIYGIPKLVVGFEDEHLFVPGIEYPAGAGQWEWRHKQAATPVAVASHCRDCSISFIDGSRSGLLLSGPRVTERLFIVVLSIDFALLATIVCIVRR